jgi:hypothetical protein
MLRQMFLRPIVLLSLVCALDGPAAARSEKTLAYARDQAWPTAVRFLRVDERLAVTDKDEAAGYFARAVYSSINARVWVSSRRFFAASDSRA